MAAAETGSNLGGVRTPVSEPRMKFLARVLYSMNVWTVVCLALGAADAFIGRHAMNPDGLSYLEIGQTALRVGVRGLENGYWSPGYPALIAATFALVRPGSAAEFPVVHALNFAILVATVFILRRLARSWIGDAQSTTADATGASALIPISFGMFVSIASAVSPTLVSPDLAVLATTLLIALACQKLRTSGTWWTACALGASCALGYWMKTAMLPLGAMLLGLLFILPPSIERARAKVIAAGAVWLLASLPVIGLTSAAVGRLSYGETGRLNYAWSVLHEPEFGSLTHPRRVVLAAPKVIEFATPIPGTFPLFYDLSYWSEGTPVHFDPRKQLRTLASNVEVYANLWLTDYPGVVAILVALAVIAGLPPRDRSRPRADVLLLWAVGWLGVYAAVLIEPRYTAPAVLMLSYSLMRTFMHRVTGAMAMRVAIVAAGFVLLKSASVGRRTLSEIRNIRQPAYLELADRLRAVGLTPTTQIATVGLSDAYRAYFAHAGGLRVTAAVLDSTGEWPVTGPELDQVKAALAQAGVRAIVRPHGPVDPSGAAWQRITLSDGTVAGVAFTNPR